MDDLSQRECSLFMFENVIYVCIRLHNFLLKNITLASRTDRPVDVIIFPFLFYRANQRNDFHSQFNI